MKEYKVNFTSQFLRKFHKLTKQEPSLKQRIRSKVKQLVKDPFYPSLSTHKYKNDYSSKITGDIRMIWNFTAENEVTLFNLGGHSGKRSVY